MLSQKTTKTSYLFSARQGNLAALFFFMSAVSATIEELFGFNPNRSSDIGEIARLCHAACFWPGRPFCSVLFCSVLGILLWKPGFRHGGGGGKGFRCMAGKCRLDGFFHEWFGFEWKIMTICVL